jgi:predicted RNase H-like nuclease (RuvC/YqgF family)
MSTNDIILAILAFFGSSTAGIIVSVIFARRKDNAEAENSEADVGEKYKKMADDQATQIRELRQCQREQDTKIDALQRDNIRIGDENRALVEKVAKLEAIIMDAKKTNAALLETVDLLKGRISTLEADNARLVEENKEIPELRARIAALEEENKKLKGSQ